MRRQEASLKVRKLLPDYKAQQSRRQSPTYLKEDNHFVKIKRKLRKNKKKSGEYHESQNVKWWNHGYTIPSTGTRTVLQKENITKRKEDPTAKANLNLSGP
jgi:hypothetical protein